jgi:hypothetical protein
MEYIIVVQNKLQTILKFKKMRVLSINQMASIQGASVASGFCWGMAAVSFGATVAAATNWWNPVGWVAGVIIVADAGCLVYTASQLE